MLNDALMNVLANLLDDFLDTRWMDSAIRNQLLQGLCRDGLTHTIEARNADHARRVIDENVNASQLFNCSNVAAFASNDAPLHFFAGDLHAANGRI